MKIRVTILLFIAAYGFTFGMPALALDEYYAIDRSMRALGMGGAFYGLSDDEYALFYNPAGLSQYRGKPKLMFGLGVQASTPTFAEVGSVVNIINQQGGKAASILNALSGYAGEPAYANIDLMPVYYVQKNFAIALLLNNTKVQAAALGQDFDTSLDVTAISDSGIVVGYSRDITENWHVGVNLKGIYRIGGYKSYGVLDIAQQASVASSLSDIGGGGFGIDADLGAIYDIPNLPFGLLNQVGLTLSNIFASDFNMLRINGAGAPPGLDRMLSIGFHSVFPGVGVIDNFHVVLDFAEFGIGGESDPNLGARDGSFFKHVNFGVEMPMDGWFVARVGFHQGDPTAGVGVRTPFVDIDLATYGEELLTGINRLTSRRVGLRLAFGFGAPPPPPYYPKPSPDLGPQDSQDPRLNRPSTNEKNMVPESLDDDDLSKPPAPIGSPSIEPVP
jgi:hypothetical protein